MRFQAVERIRAREKCGRHSRVSASARDAGGGTPVTAPPVSMAVDWIVPKPTNKGKRYMTFSRRSLIGAATAAAVTPLIRPRAQGAPTIKIGVLNDMSGPYLNITGTTSIVCCKQALEDFGVSGKGLNVEAISADHQNKPDLAVSIARQWFDRDGVDVILDVPTSSVALAVQGVVREKTRSFLPPLAQRRY